MTTKKAKNGQTDTELKEANKMVFCLFEEFGVTIRGSLKYPEKEYKIYELYCVYELLEWMNDRYGVKVSIDCGDVVKVRQTGGKIDKECLHFDVTSDDGSVNLEIHMNIHFLTLGSYLSTISTNKYDKIKKIINLKKNMKNTMRLRKMNCIATDCKQMRHEKRVCKNCEIEKSFLHEIDIILMEKYEDCSYPSFDMILLGIECKNHSVFDKHIIREALGVRRELSFYTPFGRRWDIDRIFGCKKQDTVNAYPSSLYWLASPNSKIENYDTSPEVYGVTMQHWQPPWKIPHSE